MSFFTTLSCAKYSKVLGEETSELCLDKPVPGWYLPLKKMTKEMTRKPDLPLPRPDDIQIGLLANQIFRLISAENILKFKFESDETPLCKVLINTSSCPVFNSSSIFRQSRYGIDKYLFVQDSDARIVLYQHTLYQSSFFKLFNSRAILFPFHPAFRLIGAIFKKPKKTGQFDLVTYRSNGKGGIIESCSYGSRVYEKNTEYYTNRRITIWLVLAS